MRDWIKNHKVASAAAGVLAIGLAAWLAFGFFGIQSLWTEQAVSEAGPSFGATATEPTATGAEKTEATESEGTMTEGTKTEDTETSKPGEITTVAQGTFAGADAAHDVKGTATVLTDGSSQRFLRFTDFEATNGPDLFVYLRAENGEFINLGKLKGNIGDQNYEIPADVDLKVYSTVQIWCDRFSVNFGSAELA